MRRYIAILLCMAVAIGAVACQPTPEKEIVMGEDGIMDYSRILSDISTSYVKEEALPDGIHLKVQAEVIKPDDELCIGIIERYPFDAAMAEKVGDILWGRHLFMCSCRGKE